MNGSGKRGTSAPPAEEVGGASNGSMGRRRLLTGWGRTSPSMASVLAVDDAEDLVELLSTDRGFGQQPPRAAGVIARGLGRSYGDAAQCAGGLVIDTSRFDGIGVIDPGTGLVEVGGGVSLDALIRASLPRGWFIPVSPGTRQVTVGGAIAADVHGKNHHRDGSFCTYVASLTLVTPLGSVTVSPDDDPEIVLGHRGRNGPDRSHCESHTPPQTSRDGMGGG